MSALQEIVYLRWASTNQTACKNPVLYFIYFTEIANSGRAEASCLSRCRAVPLTQLGSLSQQRDHDRGVAAADGSVQRPHPAVVHVLNHGSFLHQILHLGEEMKHALEHGFWYQRQTKQIRYHVTFFETH